MKGNVLVIGDSGTGKSTLINAVLGLSPSVGLQRAGIGKESETTELVLRESDLAPFNLIDTIGFDFSKKGKEESVKEIKKWAKTSTKKGNTDMRINAIWLCVDGTRGRMLASTLRGLMGATSIYKSVPVIVVITKSISLAEIPQNIDMVGKYLSTEKRFKNEIPPIIPVLAEAYPISDEVVVPAMGIEKLIEETNMLMEAGIKAANADIAEYLKMGRMLKAQGLVIGSAVTGVAKTFLLKDLSDASVLNALEKTELKAIAKVYDIDSQYGINDTINKLITNGGATKLAHLAQGELLSFLQVHPKLKIASNLVNAIISSVVIIVIGEISIGAFASIANGENSIEDDNWIDQLFDKNAKKKVQETTLGILGKLPDSPTISDITNSIKEFFTSEKADSSDAGIEKKEKQNKQISKKS